MLASYINSRMIYIIIDLIILYIIQISMNVTFHLPVMKMQHALTLKEALVVNASMVFKAMGKFVTVFSTV